VECELAEETEVLRENLPQCHFVYHKSHMIWPQVWTQATTVGSRQLSAWAMAWPFHLSSYHFMWYTETLSKPQKLI
jgi:hypothetical protein